MQTIKGVRFLGSTQEELLPGYTSAFPHISTNVLLRLYPVPWHWHPAAELFLVTEGTIEYSTPGGTWVFPEGSGGLVLPDVLHATRLVNCRTVRQRIHLFSPDLLSGSAGHPFADRYLSPITERNGLELLPILPGTYAADEVLSLLRRSFDLQEIEFGYEFRLRNILSDIWLWLLRLPMPEALPSPIQDEKARTMLRHIETHFQEDLKVPDIAASAYISPRECERVVREQLNTTPADYLRDYRLQRACGLLLQTDLSITEIALGCGFSSSGAFGQCFRANLGCTPGEYRKSRQDFDTDAAES